MELTVAGLSDDEPIIHGLSMDAGGDTDVLNDSWTREQQQQQQQQAGQLAFQVTGLDGADGDEVDDGGLDDDSASATSSSRREPQSGGYWPRVGSQSFSLSDAATRYGALLSSSTAEPAAAPRPATVQMATTVSAADTKQVDVLSRSIYSSMVNGAYGADESDYGLDDPTMSTTLGSSSASGSTSGVPLSVQSRALHSAIQEHRVAELQASVNALRRVADSEKRAAAVSQQELRHRTAEAEQVVYAARHQVELSEQESNSLLTMNSSLRQELAQVKLELMHTRAQLEMVDKWKGSALEQQMELLRRVENKETALAAAVSEAAGSAEARAQALAQLAVVSATADAAKRRAEEETAAKLVAMQHAAELKSERDTARAKLQMAEARAAELDATVQSLQRKLARQQAEGGAAKSDADGLMSRLAAAATEKAQLIAANESLAAEYERVLQRLETVQRCLEEVRPGFSVPEDEYRPSAISAPLLTATSVGEVAALKAEREELMGRLVMERQKRLAAEKDGSEQGTEVQALRDLVDRLTIELEAAHSVILDLNENMSRVDARAAAADRYGSQAEEFRRQLDEVQGKMQSLRHENADLRVATTTVSQDRDRLQRELSAVQAELQEALQQNALQAGVSTGAAMQRSLKRANEEHELQRAQWERSLAELMAERATLHDSVDALTAEVQAKDGTIQSLLEEIRALQAAAAATVVPVQLPVQYVQPLGAGANSRIPVRRMNAGNLYGASPERERRKGKRGMAMMQAPMSTQMVPAATALMPAGVPNNGLGSVRSQMSQALLDMETSVQHSVMNLSSRHYSYTGHDDEDDDTGDVLGTALRKSLSPQ